MIQSRRTASQGESTAKPDLTTRLANLQAYSDIVDLRSRYGWAAARGDAAGIAACFTEDCRYEGPAGGAGKRDTVHTRAGLNAYLAARLKPGQQLPYLFNHIIEVDGDHAEGTCAIKAQVDVGGGKQMVGYYVEKLRKTSDGWRFYDRRFYLYQPYFETPQEA